MLNSKVCNAGFLLIFKVEMENPAAFLLLSSKCGGAVDNHDH